MLKDYETLGEAARRLRITESLVRRWCREGKLDCFKVNKRAWLVKRDSEPDVVRRAALQPCQAKPEEERNEDKRLG